MMRTNRRYGDETGPRRVGLISALVLHAVAIAAILSHPPSRAAIAAAVPIMVNLIPSAPVAQPQIPPKPLPVRSRIESKPTKPI